MEKVDIKQIEKAKPNPIFEGLAESLKDPKNFNKIEKKLQNVLKSDHTHKTVKAYVTCAWCNERRLRRQEMLKNLGFTGIQQYMEWKKVMTIIKNKSSFQVK